MAGKITLRKYNGQVGEVMEYVSAINILTPLGLPYQKAPSVVTWGWGSHDLLADLGNNALVSCIANDSILSVFLVSVAEFSV